MEPTAQTTTAAASKPDRMSKKLVDLSKYLSFVLRHGANEIGVKIDTAGFVNVAEVLSKKNGYTFEEIKYVVANNNKKRFEMVEITPGTNTLAEHFKIRAVQGHTIENIAEEELFEEIKDPAEIPFVIHGTDYKAWVRFIRFQGLKRMARNHIHFAIGFNTDSNVISGMRNSSDIVIELDTAKAMKDGYRFLRSKNDVILSPGKGPEGQIPPAYFKKVTYTPKGKDAKPIDFDLRPFEHLLILDFEANCIDGGALECQEIIEFPVVPVHIPTKTIQVDKIFHTYVKPTVVPTITEFCTGLTGITQAQVNAGLPIKDVLANLDKWMTTHGYTAENSTIVTCGAWDLKTCLRKEAEYKKIDLPLYLRKFINVKDAWMCTFFKAKGDGMPGMLNSLNLTLDGKHHSGIDDSKNIAKIVLGLIEKGAVFTRAQEYNLADKHED